MTELANLLGLSIYDPVFWMPLACMAAFSLLVLMGAILDGFDLGVALLLPFAGEHRNRMMGLLGPWRNINEFWLLLGIVFFMAIFPKAWAFIFTVLYWPMIMIALGVMLRNIAYEFRLRSSGGWRHVWTTMFFVGALCMVLGQGWVLGKFAVNFQEEPGYDFFALFIALCVVALYALLGALWLVMRLSASQGSLQTMAIKWARRTVRLGAAGLFAVMAALGFSNTGIFYKWALFDTLGMVLPGWLLILSLFVLIEILLRHAHKNDWLGRLPFILLLLVIVLAVAGFAYSYFPFLVYDELSLWDSIDSVATLRLLVWGMAFVLPVMLVYFGWVYGDMFDKLR
ncbi:cytochrome d ubiquinol oxidase subunit II [Advenella sp. WQ 585]|uniref:Cytochrome d ubiquinol oxidase subunit II n=1 Tax=Advenella mandrilli TaxID=2800330 RepID=A0ABS1E9V5_9BURK|nr:cytochrome d ubiquinol oxidase subunit II [Advenella mandrilli]MBK1780279.1 cytochrome d ubiquinol oxidase subunit II [Advenella mandrilli]